MEVIELTSDNIDNYLEDCLAVQKFLLKPDESIDPEQFKLTADSDHSYFIALVDGDRAIGLGVVNKIIHPVRTNAYIDNIVVHEDYRGKGLFTVLMDALEDKAKEWGAERVKLTCSRPAVWPLYEKRGYKEKDTKYYSKKI